MALDYWLKQVVNSPLFPDLLWSKPENKKQAGKLLIVGGTSGSFKNVNLAYNNALKAGIGVCRLYLPNSLSAVLAGASPDVSFGPSTQSGGFSRQALADLLDLSIWADGVLLAGDLGKNSETSILIESFIDKYSGILLLANDAIDICFN